MPNIIKTKLSSMTTESSPGIDFRSDYTNNFMPGTALSERSGRSTRMTRKAETFVTPGRFDSNAVATTMKSSLRWTKSRADILRKLGTVQRLHYSQGLARNDSHVPRVCQIAVRVPEEAHSNYLQYQLSSENAGKEWLRALNKEVAPIVLGVQNTIRVYSAVVRERKHYTIKNDEKSA